MTFPCQKRLWRLLTNKDRALLRAVYHHGVSYHVLAVLMGVSRVTIRRRMARLMVLLRDEKVIRAMEKAKGVDLYLLRLRYVYGLSAVKIAQYAGISGDNGGKSAGAIRRRIRRIVTGGEDDGKG